MISLVILSGCAQRPQQTVSGDTVSAEQIANHQAQINKIKQRELQGRIAFFDDLNRDRSAASLVWSWQPALETEQQPLSKLRLYHPLRGTLAELRVNHSNAQLNMGDNQYIASTVDELLYNHLNLPIPYTLITHAALSRIPAKNVSNIAYFDSGAPASFTYTHPFTQIEWELEFNDYRLVPLRTESVNLPHRIQIHGSNYRIQLQVNEWSLAND